MHNFANTIIYMGLSPKTWGPQGWHFIHSVAITFPENATEEQQQAYQNFFFGLADVLPCELCRENFKQKLLSSPPPYGDAKKMFQWSVDLHNEVNKQNNKPTLTYEQAARALHVNGGNKLKKIITTALFASSAGFVISGIYKKSLYLSMVGGVLGLSAIIMQYKGDQILNRINL